jgi:hypothetical protein
VKTNAFDGRRIRRKERVSTARQGLLNGKFIVPPHIQAAKLLPTGFGFEYQKLLEPPPLTYIK